jgi:predicted MFS family arabinose efflux permease
MTFSLPIELRRLFLRVPALRTFFIVDAAVLVCELGVAVVVPWWITAHAGVEAMASYGIAIALGTLLATPALSPFGDRYCKGTQITVGLAVLMASFLGLGICALDGKVRLPTVIALGLASVLADAFVGPARQAIVAELAPADDLPAALQIQKTCRSFSGVLGPVQAGVALAAIGVAPALFACAAGIALALALSLRIDRQPTVERAGGGFASWWHELQAGVAGKWKVPMERGWTVVNFFVWIFQGPAVGMLIPIKLHSLGLGGQWMGLSLGALSVGTLLGSMFGSRLLVQRFGRYRVRLGLGAFEGLCLAVVGLSWSPALLLVGLLMAGVCNASMSLVGATHRALAIPRRYRVRMLAAGTVTTQVAGALGPALVGLALHSLSVKSVYGSFGLLMAVCAMGLALVPRLKEFLNLEHTEVVDWYARQYPRVFP